MNIRILYDNRAKAGSLASGWGFSCLAGDSVLFDTGGDGSARLKNMVEMGVDPGRLEAVVISHDHWDHTGGLTEILSIKRGLKVYICPGSGDGLKHKIRETRGIPVECDGVREVKKDIYVTGMIPGKYKNAPIEEQALAVRTSLGLTVLTGCAHPGILEIVETVRRLFPGEEIYCVMGGFHLKGRGKLDVEEIIEKLRKMGVKKAGPAHCSGDEAIRVFGERYGDGHIDIAAGVDIEV